MNQPCKCDPCSITFIILPEGSETQDAPVMIECPDCGGEITAYPVQDNQSEPSGFEDVPF